MSDSVTHTPLPEVAPAGQRGPVEHERRQQILGAAHGYFKTYGYAKTTVGDIAKAIGLSPAYVYKFFDSKQAVGEAVVREAIAAVTTELSAIAGGPKPAATRMRQIYRTVAERTANMCFNDRKMFDLAVAACDEKWQVIEEYQAYLFDLMRGLIIEGREAGEFERKTPIIETTAAILMTLEMFARPALLEQNLDDPVGRSENIANLVLRSLAP